MLTPETYTLPEPMATKTKSSPLPYKVNRDGKKYYGVITKVIKEKKQAMVLINGNKKSTLFYIGWIKVNTK